MEKGEGRRRGVLGSLGWRRTWRERRKYTKNNKIVFNVNVVFNFNDDGSALLRYVIQQLTP